MAFLWPIKSQPVFASDPKLRSLSCSPRSSHALIVENQLAQHPAQSPLAFAHSPRTRELKASSSQPAHSQDFCAEIQASPVSYP